MNHAEESCCITFGELIRGSGFANSCSKHGVQAEPVLLNQNEVIWKEEVSLLNVNYHPAMKQGPPERLHIRARPQTGMRKAAFYRYAL